MWIGQAFRARVGLALLGTAGGYALWMLVRNQGLAEQNPHEFLFIASFAVVFFHSALLMIGPMRVRRAVPSALLLGLVLSGLFTWASLRFETFEAFVDAPTRIAAAASLFVLPIPYLIATQGPGWRHYPTLFAQAWSLLVRSLGAWVFVGTVWLLLFLSNALLGLVGVRTITNLLEIEGLPWALTGAIFGLGLAVVNEFTDFLSPYLTLRLLRLLVPVALVVSLVFLAALPLHGLSTFFGGISSAQTLLAMALGNATLVTLALAERDDDAVQAALMIRATQALALVLPVLAGLGAAAVWLRVAQYGWTPTRIASSIVAASALGYGVIYGASVLRGHGWQSRIRQGNALIAPAIWLLVALTFTPLLNAQRISAASQFSRYSSGRSSLADLDIAALSSDWGRPGRAALRKLQALSDQPGQEALKERLAAVAAGQSDRDASRNALAAELRKVLPVRPEPAAGSRQPLLTALLRNADAVTLREWLNACRRSTPNGKPGCVLVSGKFLPQAAGSQALLLYRTPTGALRSEGVVFDPVRGLLRSAASDFSAPDGPAVEADALIGAVLQGKATIEPAQINALTFGNHQFVIMPGIR